MAIHHLHFILRPGTSGIWFVQDDGSHASFGVDKITGVVHEPDHIRVYFNPVYAKAGTVQITTDDNFAGALTANANLGTQSVSIYLRAHPHMRGIDAPIDPKRIWEYLRPAQGYTKDGGNLWVNVTMCD
jgi:hypothetical protein